jgi:hypothetical protein
MSKILGALFGAYFLAGMVVWLGWMQWPDAPSHIVWPVSLTAFFVGACLGKSLAP